MIYRLNMSTDRFCEHILSPRLGCSTNDYSPILVFGFLYPRKTTVANITKSTCVNEMAPSFELFAVVLKCCITHDKKGTNASLPTIGDG